MRKGRAKSGGYGGGAGKIMSRRAQANSRGVETEAPESAVQICGAAGRELAAHQFIQLCQADYFKGPLFGVAAAVDMFMRACAP